MKLTEYPLRDQTIQKTQIYAACAIHHAAGYSHGYSRMLARALLLSAGTDGSSRQCMADSSLLGRTLCPRPMCKPSYSISVRAPTAHVRHEVALWRCLATAVTPQGTLLVSTAVYCLLIVVDRRYTGRLDAVVLPGLAASLQGARPARDDRG